MRILIVLSLAALFFSSCRSSDLIRPGDTVEEAFDKAKNQFDNENYSEAARAFETVISMGRGTDIGQDAQFYLAESYFNSRRYLVAASEYARYTQFHPNSPRREEVDFKEALSYYHLSPRYRLDQSHTRKAIERFRLFNSRYPDSERIAEAGEYIDEMREKLARKEYNAAAFYMRTNRYNAAAIYYDKIVDQYPETDWAEQALVEQIEAYILYAENSVENRQEERYEMALDSYGTYLQLFPRGDNRSRAEDLYDRAQRGLETVRANGSVAASDR